MRKPQAKRRQQHAGSGDQQRRPVTHDVRAQAQAGPERSGHADREQSDRSGLRNAHPGPEDQQRHREDATAGTCQRKDRAGDQAQQDVDVHEQLR